MTLQYKDRVFETSATAGSGAYALAGRIDATYRTFGSVCADGDTCYYCAADHQHGGYEIGLGTYSAGTLTRTTILTSSNSDAPVVWPTGVRDIFLTDPAAAPGSTAGMAAALAAANALIASFGALATTTTAAFTQPAVAANVSVSFANTGWMAAGQNLFITGGGNYSVASITSGTVAVLTNQGVTGNAAPGATVPTAAKAVACGVQGPAGVVSQDVTTQSALNRATYMRETAGGDLVPGGNYSISTWGGPVTMYLPTVANSAKGDEIRITNYQQSWSPSGMFTINCHANTVFTVNGTVDTSIVARFNHGGFTLVCAENNGTNAYWAVKQ